MNGLHLHYEHSTLSDTVVRLFERKQQGIEKGLVSEGELEHLHASGMMVQDLLDSHHTYDTAYFIGMHFNHTHQRENGFRLFTGCSMV